MGDFRKFSGYGLGQLLLTASCYFLVCGPAAAGQAPAPTRTMLVEPPAPLLPANLGKLTRVSPGDAGDGIHSVDPPDKAVLQEDGLRRFARSDYAAGQNGPATGSITVYQFGDVSGAISAFDYFLKPGMRPEKNAKDVVVGKDELLMRTGPNVVVEHLKVDSGELSAVNNDLMARLPKAQGPAAQLPLLPSLLPSKALVPDSVRYALGPAGYQAMGGSLPPQTLGFQKSAEVISARYRNGGLLTAVLYPTPEIAGEFDRAMTAALQQSQGAPKFSIRREGTLVVLATGAWPAGEGQKMVDSVHMRSEVTFDKPMPLQFQSEVRKTYTLLQSIAIFCGLGALAAIVLGLFFGGGRALIRVMQGKPAATEPEFLRIDLRGIGGRNLKGSGQ